MTESELAAFLKERNLLEKPTITYLGKGEANVNYLAESGGEKLVVRVVRQDVPTSPRFYNEQHYMLFAESIGILFAPRSILYDSDRGIHVVSFVAGEDRSVVDLDHRQQDTFISQLKQLDSVTYEQYQKLVR